MYCCEYFIKLTCAGLQYCYYCIVLLSEEILLIFGLSVFHDVIINKANHALVSFV